MTMSGSAAPSLYRVCFVCTGNICRSPMIEQVFRTRAAQAGLAGVVEADSAGTSGWHEGDAADPRTVRVLKAAGYGTTHRARRFRADWFGGRDLVVALDRGHDDDLRRMAPTRADADKVRLLRSFDPEAGQDLDVPDPYFGDLAGFEECLRLCEAACAGLFDFIRQERAGLGAL
jgi:protein-tyrosine phosphatase